MTHLKVILFIEDNDLIIDGGTKTQSCVVHAGLAQLFTSPVFHFFLELLCVTVENNIVEICCRQHFFLFNTGVSVV